MMLQNEREAQFTKTQLARMEQALTEAQEKMATREDIPLVVRQAHLNGIRALLGDLQAQLAEYEALRSGQVRALPMPSVLNDLPATLVRARIARGWTHRDLAKALGTSEQQIQKDEAGVGPLSPPTMDCVSSKSKKTRRAATPKRASPS